MKAVALGFVGFLVAAMFTYGGLVAYRQFQKERLKEAILADLVCQSLSTQQKFGIQCPVAAPVATPGNVSPPAPDKQK